MEYWYRYEETFIHKSPPIIYLRHIPVDHYTPKGVWLNNYGDKKFVLKKSRKHFACPTIEEAKQSYVERKSRQRAILRSQLKATEQLLGAAMLKFDIPIYHNRDLLPKEGEIDLRRIDEVTVDEKDYGKVFRYV